MPAVGVLASVCNLVSLYFSLSLSLSFSLFLNVSLPFAFVVALGAWTHVPLTFFSCPWRQSHRHFQKETVLWAHWSFLGLCFVLYLDFSCFFVFYTPLKAGISRTVCASHDQTCWNVQKFQYNPTHKFAAGMKTQQGFFGCHFWVQECRGLTVSPWQHLRFPNPHHAFSAGLAEATAENVTACRVFVGSCPYQSH